MGHRSDTVSLHFLSVGSMSHLDCAEMERSFQVTLKDTLDSGIQLRVLNCKLSLLMARMFWAWQSGRLVLSSLCLVYLLIICNRTGILYTPPASTRKSLNFHR